MRHSACVQALSCDEAYMDVTGLGDPESIAATVRAEVAAITQCTASAGKCVFVCACVCMQVCVWVSVYV